MMFAIHPLPTASVSHAMPAESADHALVRAAAEGDRHAFERLYRRHSARVFAVILRLQGGDRGRAEDLTQEAFVRVWQKLPEFRFESAFSTWLHRLAVNTALMALRSARGEPGADEDVSDPDFHFADGMARLPDLGIDLDKVIAKLPPRARAVLVLHDVEGWKHEEISDELGMAVGSSKAQLHRARNLLKQWLGGPHGRA
jgi:RNA polymerase sigma-70 factor (ECF subfamily)